MNKQKTNVSCWNCPHKIFKPKEPGKVGSTFCIKNNDWFKPGYDFAKEHDCKFR